MLLVNIITLTWSQNQNLIKAFYFGERYFVQNIENMFSEETWEEINLTLVNLFVIRKSYFMWCNTLTAACWIGVMQKKYNGINTNLDSNNIIMFWFWYHPVILSPYHLITPPPPQITVLRTIHIQNIYLSNYGPYAPRRSCITFESMRLATLSNDFETSRYNFYTFQAETYSHFIKVYVSH